MLTSSPLMTMTWAFTKYSIDLVPDPSPYSRQPYRYNREDRNFSERQRQELHANVSGAKKTRLDPGLFWTASQLPRANELKAKKRPDAKASLGSAALDRASSLYDLRQQLSHKIEAFRGKRPAQSERKATKQAAKPTAKTTENKRHKLSQDSPAATSNMKAGKAPQPAAALNRDSHIIYSKFKVTDSSFGTDARPKVAKKKKVVRQVEVNAETMKNIAEYDPGRRAKEAQEKRHWHRALDRAEGIKVRDDPVLLAASLKRREKRRQQRRKKWDSRSQRDSNVRWSARRNVGTSSRHASRPCFRRR
ncbi:uncharacterized protein LOC119403589 [Rhipicephalus sanguineus]|uniref:uncharacterized protein LOC119403589 n=1 Tax=Rhipicephalus sanguineus TaxID=34632 RepID=UPI0018944898|nr:uncharacterized protein LOC119403589 [Rhipicephalus sanguineus]